MRKYDRTDSICVVAEADGFKFTAVYRLEWRQGGRDRCEASVLTTVPRYASADGVFDLNAASGEPIDFIPRYVRETLDAANSKYAEHGEILTIKAINAMDYCLEGEFDALDNMYSDDFGKLFVTYESHTEAMSN